MQNRAMVQAMEKVAKTIRIDRDVSEALEDYAKLVARKKPNALLQEIVIEYLHRKKAWPPKEK